MTRQFLVPDEPSYALAEAQYLFEGDRLEIPWPYAEGGTVEIEITKVVVGKKITTVYFDPEASKPFLTHPILHFSNDEKVSANGDPEGYLEKESRRRQDAGIE